MDQYAIFTLLWSNFAIPVDIGGAALTASLMATVAPWFKLCVPAYLIVVMLIAMWTGDERANTLLFRSAFLASILFALSFQAGTFDHFVNQLVHGTTQELRVAAAAGIGKGQVANANAYDILATRCYSAGLVVYQKLPEWSFKGAMLVGGVLIYWFLSFAGVLWMFAVDLISYALGDLLVDVGPIFIPLYFASYTRRWFDGWLACLMTTVIAQILTAALASLFTGTLNIILDSVAAGLLAPNGPDGDAVVGAMMSLDILALVCVVFAILAAGVIYIAIRIAGGAYVQMEMMPSPSWFGSGSSQPVQNAPQTGGSIANAPAPSLPAQPAFTRTVGAAL